MELHVQCQGLNSAVEWSRSEATICLQKYDNIHINNKALEIWKGKLRLIQVWKELWRSCEPAFQPKQAQNQIQAVLLGALLSYWVLEKPPSTESPRSLWAANTCLSSWGDVFLTPHWEVSSFSFWLLSLVLLASVRSLAWSSSQVLEENRQGLKPSKIYSI